MKKNGQYVGVDEKYIPEEEKYVDNTTNEEVKDAINDGFRSVKNYVTDKDNQEKFKRAGKKGLKIAKGIGIGYLIFWGVMILLFIVIFVFAFVSIFKGYREMNKTINDNEIIDNVTDRVEDNEIMNGITDKIEQGFSDFEIDSFNQTFELYSGTQSASFVKILLDKVVTNNKKEKDHIITVIYNGQSTNEPSEIVNMKKTLVDRQEYEVSLDYNSDGFVSKVTID